MELADLIKKYREVAALTQTMFAEEISHNTNGAIKPTIGVINGIERRGAVTDDKLNDYLHKKFYFVDTTKNSRVVSLSYQIAESCVRNGLELDYKRLFSCITLMDVYTYLNEIYELNEEEEELLKGMSNTIEFQFDSDWKMAIVNSDTGIFVFNLCLWYFFLSNKFKPTISKKEYSSEKFVRNATLFGFPEFSTTSEKARGKIARTIIKRISICEHFIDFYERIDFNSYCSFDTIKLYQTLYMKEYYSVDDITLNIVGFDDIIRVIESGTTEWEEEDVANVISQIYKVQSNLLCIYGFFQGVPIYPSKRYVEELKSKFVNQHLYKFNLELKEKVEALVEKFNIMMENDLDKLHDLESALKICDIQHVLFRLYKYYYVLNSQLYNVDEFLTEKKIVEKGWIFKT